jgi:cardiolipin synthase
MAKSRGVDVRVLIPTEADHLGVYLAGFHYEFELAEAGIPVYRYTKGFMHQKCLLVDDQLTMIGSTNLDNRSLYLNFELMIAIDQPDFVAEVTTMLEGDFASAIHSNAPDAKPRWWYQRTGTAVARLFSPIL